MTKGGQILNISTQDVKWSLLGHVLVVLVLADDAERELVDKTRVLDELHLVRFDAVVESELLADLVELAHQQHVGEERKMADQVFAISFGHFVERALFDEESIVVHEVEHGFNHVLPE